MASIKILFMDVDGTMTDGKIYIGENGECMKAFSVHDGYAIANLLPKNEILPVIITGRKSEIVQKRASELGITEIHQGVKNKLEEMKAIAKTYQATAENLAYIGDDLNDLECMEYCGVSACPADAVEEILMKVDYVCKRAGGQGAVREFIDWLLR